MTGLTEEEKEILRKAEEIKRRMEEDIDLVPDDFGEPVKKKKNAKASLDKENFVGYEEVADEEILEEVVKEKIGTKERTQKEETVLQKSDTEGKNTIEMNLEEIGLNEVLSEGDSLEKRDCDISSEEHTQQYKANQNEAIEQKRDDVQPDDKELLKGEKKETKSKSSNKSSSKRSKKKKSKIRRIGSFIWKCIFAILLFLLLLYVGVRYIVGKTNYQPLAMDYVRAEDVVSKNYVKNYLIIGTDARNENDASRSDAMIIFSINEKTGKIILTSILRDSYVPIPGRGQDRINAAYQFGGAALTIQTIEQNFKVAIDGYIKIDFFSFVDIVDAVGGVYIDVDEGEKNLINGYLAEINNLLGVPVGDGTLDSAGFQLLNGKQALSYARIRYIGTDFQRTERQREVIEAVLAQVKSSNPMELYTVVNKVLPQIDTNLEEHTMSMIIMKAILYLGYDIEQNRVPMDGTWNYAVLDGKDVISLDLNANSQGMLEFIYGE